MNGDAGGGGRGATDGLELWLVRHGQTSWNTEGRFAGWSDVPLTAEGEEQARALVELLRDERFDGVWSSDLQRAVHTARLAYGEPRQDQRIREMNFGDLEGAQWEGVDSTHKDSLLAFESFSAPGGEDLEGFKARVLAFVDDLPPGRHLIFTHGGTIRALTRAFGEDRFLFNGALLAVDWTGQRVLFMRETKTKPTYQRKS